MDTFVQSLKHFRSVGMIEEKEVELIYTLVFNPAFLPFCRAAGVLSEQEVKELAETIGEIHELIREPKQGKAKIERRGRK